MKTCRTTTILALACAASACLATPPEPRLSSPPSALGSTTAPPVSSPASLQEAAATTEPVTEQTYGPERSNFLLTLAGAWTRQTFQLDDAETTTAQATVGLSYFLNRSHELGLSVGIQSIESESSFFEGGNLVTEKIDGETIFVNALYNYNFYVTPRTGFYLGPQVGWGRFDSGVSSTSEPQYGVHVGLRHWLHPRVAITVEPQYYFVSFDDDQGGESDVYQILFGLAARL